MPDQRSREAVRTRSQGVVVKNMFEHAFVSYRGMVFWVSDVVERRGSRWSIPPDVYGRIRERIEAFGEGWHLPLNPTKLTIVEPAKVIANLSDKTFWFRCDRCGQVNRRPSFRNFNPSCDNPNCGARYMLVQVPVFVGRPRNLQVTSQQAPTMDDDELVKGMHDGAIYRQYVQCRSCGTKYMHLEPADKREPIGSLRWICPRCGNTTRLQAPHSKFLKFIPVLPSEAITRPNFISDSREKQVIETIDPTYWRSIIRGATSLRFSSLNVYEMTYGYKISGYPIRFHTDDETTWTVFARRFHTTGFAIDVSSSVYPEADKILRDLSLKRPEAEKDFRTLVLHTIKHSLLRHLSAWTGIEDSKFHGGFIVGGQYTYYDEDETPQTSSVADQVFVFDTEYGGTGACKTLRDDKRRLLSWLDDARKRLKNCDMDCKVGYCKACIYLNHCGFQNKRLMRYAAAPFFGLSSEDFIV